MFNCLQLIWFIHFLLNMLPHIHHFPLQLSVYWHLIQALISETCPAAVPRSPSTCHWSCSFKGQKRRFCPSGFNFWGTSKHFSMSAWQFTLLSSSENWSSLLGSFMPASLKHFGFPAVSSCLRCCQVGYCDHFVLFPLDCFLFRWMPSDFLYCCSVTPSGKVI